MMARIAAGQHQSVEAHRGRVVWMLIRLAGVVILAGGVAKLFWGTPASLPAFLQHLDAVPVGWMLGLVVLIELTIGVSSLTAPRVVWPATVALLTVFTGVSGTQLALGETSCGCFGSAVTIPPIVMVTVDGLLLLAILVCRPWREGWLGTFSTRTGRVALIGPMIGLLGAGWLAIDVSTPRAIDDPGASTSNQVVEASGSTGTQGAGASTNDVSNVPDGAGASSADGAWQPPRSAPRYVVLNPRDWIGRDIARTPVATWIDPSTIPASARIIFFMATCPHCAEHLAELAASPGDESYFMVELPSNPTSRTPIVVNRMPAGAHVKLPDITTWIMQVPWDVKLDGSAVSNATYLGP